MSQTAGREIIGGVYRGTACGIAEREFFVFSYIHSSTQIFHSFILITCIYLILSPPEIELSNATFFRVAQLLP
jgi:hypothetical protein